jgi:hypothetical protein
MHTLFCIPLAKFFCLSGVKDSACSTVHGGPPVQQGTKNLPAGQNIKVLEPGFSVLGVSMPTANHGKDNDFDAGEFSGYSFCSISLQTNITSTWKSHGS